MNSRQFAALRDTLIAFGCGTVLGSLLTTRQGSLTPFAVAIVLVIATAGADVVAEIRRQHEEMDRLHATAMEESRRACEFYDVELRRAQEFDRYSKEDTYGKI